MLKTLYTKLSPSDASASVRTSLCTDRSSAEHLLDDSKNDAGSEVSDFEPSRHYQQKRMSHFHAIVSHTLIFATYSLGLLAASLWYTQRIGPSILTYCNNQTISAPADKAVEYEKVFYDGRLDKHSHFKGDPHQGGDKAWHDLVENINLRISGNELRKMNKTALELADGSGYHGQLNAYHHLHCLKFIREYFYSDYYTIAKSGSMTKIHIGHCIEDIRVALMCHADTSISVFNWQDDMRHPMPSFVGFTLNMDSHFPGLMGQLISLHQDLTCILFGQKRIEGGFEGILRPGKLGALVLRNSLVAIYSSIISLRYP